MDWVKATFHFPEIHRMLRLTIPRRHTQQIALDSQTSPDVACRRLRSIIAEARPELADCEIFVIGFDFQMASYEAVIYHTSLPPSVDGQGIPREFLESTDEGWRTRPAML